MANEARSIEVVVSANEAQTIEVVVPGGGTKKHKGDQFKVDEHGNLVIFMRATTVCLYAPGQWHRAHLAVPALGKE